jgi:molecular chaperone HscC
LIFGIDLGTSNSLISYIKDDEAILIPNVFGKVLTPSAVSILDDGSISVGEVAKERILTAPNKTAYAFKRSIGTKKEYQLGEHTLSSSELSSFVLKSLKEDAEAYTGEEVKEVIITVPAYFNDQQRTDTINAARLAGLTPLRLLNEPSAAALCYGVDLKEDDKNLFVFDLGGGTYDVSIVEKFDDILEIHACAGDSFLGGENFTEVIVQDFLAQIKKQTTENLILNESDSSLIYKLAEEAKFEVCKNQPYQKDFLIKESQYKVEITPEKFERISQELIKRLLTPIRVALGDAKYSIEDIDEVLLVGGASRMPIVRKFLTQIFKKLPFIHVNPDEVVGRGAAVLSGILQKEGRFKENVMTDVCPFTLGIEIERSNSAIHKGEGVFSPIIERNTTTPCSKSNTYFPVHPKSTSIGIRVFQGESRKTSENIFLGDLEIPVPIGEELERMVEVRFTYDTSGVLEVEVKVGEGKEFYKKVFKQSSSNLSDEEIAKRFEALAKIKTHPREREENKLLLEKLNRIYIESIGLLREDTDQVISVLESALNSQDEEQIQEAKAFVEQFLSSLGQHT